MQYRQNAPRLLAIAFALWSTMLACGYSTGISFGEGDIVGSPLDPTRPGTGSSGTVGTSSGTGSSSGTYTDPDSGIVYPANCGDGMVNGDETDFDCGGSCQPCAVGRACATGDDCFDLVCAGARCQPPTGTDGVKNGDESDVDCGGQRTGAGRCRVGQACAVNGDCDTNGCHNNLCIEAPSCVTRFGGETCGAGEVGSGAEQHESCCTSIEVPGYSDPTHPGKRVFVDKYEITAGRMRAFIAAMTEQFGGQPNVNAYISGNPPAVWQPGWTEFMPTATDGLIANTPNGGAHGTGSGCGSMCNVGTNYIFGAALYQYSHGHNCYHGGSDSYGFSTYWYPDDVMQNQNGGKPRVYSQEELDVKSLNCTPNVMLQAFCHWDGGQLATYAVMNTIASGGLPQSRISSSDGSQIGSYYYPARGSDTDDAARVAAPGRWVGDATLYNGAGPWMDVAGNLNEIMLNPGASPPFVLALPFGGLAESSQHAGGNSPEWIGQIEHKTAMSGGRCMRFKN